VIESDDAATEAVARMVEESRQAAARGSLMPRWCAGGEERSTGQCAIHLLRWRERGGRSGAEEKTAGDESPAAGIEPPDPSQPARGRSVRHPSRRGQPEGVWLKHATRTCPHPPTALAPELSQSEVRELQSEWWERALELALKEIDRSPAELASAPKSAPWKRALAHTLRDAVAPPYRWLAEKLCMGKPGSVRAYVHSAGLAVGHGD